MVNLFRKFCTETKVKCFTGQNKTKYLMNCVYKSKILSTINVSQEDHTHMYMHCKSQNMKNAFQEDRQYSLKEKY